MSEATDSVEVKIAELPLTLEDLLALRDGVAVTPEGGAVMLVLALMLFVRDPEASAGRHGLAACVDRSRLVQAPDGYRGWSLSVRDLQHIELQMRSNPWAPASYVVDTVPDAGYRLPEPPFRFLVSRNPYSGSEDGGRVKVYVGCSGAASARPVAMQRNNRGIWKAVEWSSLTLGVVAPIVEVDDGI